MKYLESIFSKNFLKHFKIFFHNLDFGMFVITKSSHFYGYLQFRRIHFGRNQF
jgi:hypothetical protein